MRSPHSIPFPENAQVWLDFDGTITREDVLDKLIERYAVNNAWKLIEQRWQAGLIGSRECLEQEFAQIRIGQSDLASFLDTIDIDSGIYSLLAVLRDNDVPATILSDGIGLFINHILAKNGISLPYRSNDIQHEGQHLRLQCPHASATCESAAAHCKCASATALALAGRQTIYVGDGRSDLCPSRKADLVFAKGVLARTLAAEHRAFIPFTTLEDVAATLSASWSPKAALMSS